MSFFREALITLLFSYVVAQFPRNPNTQHFSSSGHSPSSHSCVANGEVAGVCQYIRSCHTVLGYLRANVTLPTCDNNSEMVCCARERRVSYTACEEYKKVLKKKNYIPLLPLPFVEPDQHEEISCDPNLNPLISSGRDAKIDEMPFMVALGYNINQVPWRCGGTLISPEYVLTAAHCVTNRYVRQPTKILVGDITLSKRTSNTRDIVGVSRVIVHPSYKPPLTYHDIALIKLDRALNISKSAMPACLPQAEDDLLKNITSKVFTAAGFGITGAGEAQSDTLQVVNLQGYNWNLCNAFYKEISTRNIKFPKGIIRKQICAGDSFGRKDTCQGDSGGPLLLPDSTKRCVHYVVGITSFGPNQCGEKIPAIYTNVLSYLDWIESIVWKSNTNRF